MSSSCIANMVFMYNRGVTNNDLRIKWYKWINRAFIDFCAGERRTLGDFAAYLDFPAAQMSQYMARNGKIPSSPKTIAKFAKHYPEIYDVLGVAKPPDPFDVFPEDLRSALTEIKSKITEHGVSGDSSEAEEIMNEIFNKIGFVRIDKR